MRFPLSSSVAYRSIKLAQSYAAGIVIGSMNSTITITRPARDGFNDTTREYAPPTTGPVYAGIAGLTPASGSTEMDLGDEPTYYSSLTVRIPIGSAEPRIDDVIHVDTSNDPNIVGHQFRVTDVPVGGRLYSSINIQAVGIAPSKQWS